MLGGREAVASMVRTALAPPAKTATIVDARWVAQTADRVLAAMEETRSTWQMWHVRAEAQRHVRTVDVPVEQASTLVDLLVDEVLEHRSVALAARGRHRRTGRAAAGRRVVGLHRRRRRPLHLAADPGRRATPRHHRRHRDGTSRPHVVDLACWKWPRTAPPWIGQAPGPADVHLWCSAAAGDRPPAPGRPRMRALTLAWTEDGGQVIGLAPSAAAAASGEQTGIRRHLPTHLVATRRSGLGGAVGRRPVIIDEAGMADTLSLDTRRFASTAGECSADW